MMTLPMGDVLSGLIQYPSIRYRRVIIPGARARPTLAVVAKEMIITYCNFIDLNVR